MSPWQSRVVRLAPLLAALVMALVWARGAKADEPARVSGKVTDAAGAAIADAEVSVADLKLRTVTAADGSFSFAALAAGRYTLSVRRVGFAPVVLPFAAPIASPLSVTLIATAFEIAPVDVTGARQPIDPTKSPLSSASLYGDELRREHTVSLAHALESVPGVNTLSTGGQVGKPVVRGLAGPRVLVLEDGYRLEDYSWSDEDGPSVDVRLADRVELIRGPASVLYGSDALGGVVNAVPADLPDARGREGFTRGGIELYGASNNGELGTALRLEHAGGSFGSRLFLVGRKGSDLHTPDGEIPNTGFGAGNGEAVVGWRGNKANATLRYARYGGEFKLLEADAPVEETGGGEEGGPERKLGDNRIQFGSNLLLGGVRLETRAQWQNHSLIEMADEPGGAGTPGVESEQFNLLLNTYLLEVLAHLGGDRSHATLGVSGLTQDNDTRGPIPLVPDARTRSGALFGFDQIDVGRWGFLGGARVDFRHLETDANATLALPDQERDDTEASANLGLVYRLNDEVSFALNGARGWRSPSLFELYANGPHLGEARYEVGDPGLDPERGFEMDAGVRIHQPRLRLEVTGFRHSIDHYIFIAPTGGTAVVGSDTLSVYQYEQADSRLYGAELWAQVEAARPLTVRARADYVHGQNLDLDQPLPLVPPLRMALEGELHSSTLGWAERGSVGLEVEHVAEQTRLSPFDVPTGDYTLFHVDAGLAKRLGGRVYQFDLRLRNLFDTSYRSFLSRYKEFALDPGRNVVLRVSTGL